MEIAAGASSCTRIRALPRSSELERLLLDVVADGFGLYCCGPIAAPHRLVASYQWKDFVGLVTIRCFEEVTTATVPVPRHGPGRCVRPRRGMWAYEGPPRWALRALLDLVKPPIGRQAR
jgi:hypothetical protein